MQERFTISATDSLGATGTLVLERPLGTQAGALLGSAPDFPGLPVHVYSKPTGNVNTWNKPLDSTAAVVTMRFNGKPAGFITSSIAAPILAGKRDPLIDAWIADIRVLPQIVLGSVWHEPLDGPNASEFLPGEPRSLWGDVGVYVMNRFAAAGVTNVRWVPCLTGENYAAGWGPRFFTPELLARCYAIGGDDYLEKFTDPRPEADTGWMGHFNFHPESRHAVLEWGLRDSFGVNGVQPQAFAEVTRFFKAHPNWVCLVGWFNKGPHDNRLNPDGTAALLAQMNDPYFGRTVI